MERSIYILAFCFVLLSALSITIFVLPRLIIKKRLWHNHFIFLLSLILLIIIISCLLFPYAFFDLCCNIMAEGAIVLGLTYKEFCVVGNIYLQGIVLVFSAFTWMFVMINKIKNKTSFLRCFMLIFSLLYGSIFVYAFSLICLHYYMPLEDAFNLCVKELISFGQSFYNVGYVGANIIIFVVGWLFLLIFNVSIGCIMNKCIK